MERTIEILWVVVSCLALLVVTGLPAGITLGGVGVLLWLVPLATLVACDAWRSASESATDSASDPWNRALTFVCAASVAASIAMNASAVLRDARAWSIWVAPCVSALAAGVVVARRVAPKLPTALLLALPAVGMLAVAGAALAGHSGPIAHGITTMFDEGFRGAASKDAFAGATPREIAFAALRWILPGILAVPLVLRGLEPRRYPRTLLTSISVLSVTGILLGLTFAVVGDFAARGEGIAPLDAIRFYDQPIDSPEDREDSKALFDGYIRVSKGVMLSRSLLVATARGTVESPTFAQRGRPADVALHLREGEVFRVLVKRKGVLVDATTAERDAISLQGQMLPASQVLVTRTLARLSPESEPVAVGLLALAFAFAIAGLGLCLAATLRRVPPAVSLAAALLPAALTAISPWLAGNDTVALGLGVLGTAAFAARIALRVVRTRQG